MARKQRKGGQKEKVKSTAAEALTQRENAINELLDKYNEQESRETETIAFENEEANERNAQLRETQEVLDANYNKFIKNALFIERQEDWERYMTCDGLPDPGSPPDMNTFMFSLSIEHQGNPSVEEVAANCRTVVSLLKKLDEIVRTSTTMPRGRAIECETVARRCKEQLQWWIDMACYGLLRHIETDMVREDLKTARYSHACEDMICCLWTPITLPIGLKKQSDKEGKAIEVNFEEIDMSVRLPIDMDCYRMAIRVLSLGYDHYSEDAPSNAIAPIPEEYRRETDFAEFCRREHAERLAIRNEQVEGRRDKLEEIRESLDRMKKPPSPRIVPVTNEKKGKPGKKGAIPARSSRPKKSETRLEDMSSKMELPIFASPEEIIRMKEGRVGWENEDIVDRPRIFQDDTLRKILEPILAEDEVNQRKYRILGGVYHIDLIYQPPQPKVMSGDVQLTTLQVPKEPSFVPFARPYEAPSADPNQERTPEVIEAEMQALESAMEALVLVTLKLPSTVLWFEPPLVAHWIPERKIWSTKDVHDIKYNEEKQTIAFRTGRLGIHGLAAHKFANLPFQSWELKPESGRNACGGVALNISGAAIQAEFIIREDTVSLNSLVGGSSGSLKSMLGEYMKLEHLVEKMRAAGCDFFPEQDACVYVKGLAMKQPITECHLRRCMSLLCTAYTFAWSRWNGARNLREIVMQFKEIHGCLAKERSNLTLLVTPRRTMAVACTEVSPEFTYLPLNGYSKFYADLYHLARHEAGIKSRLLMEGVSFKLATTVYQLLERTNVISMSS